MLKSQEPKYDMNPQGKLYNRNSGNVIPDDEPVMIFRARDRHAAKAIQYYLSLCSDENHKDVVAGRHADFARFAVEHPDRMKEPD